MNTLDGAMARAFDHRLDAAGGDDVVFLDQDAVVEADAVVGAAADAHRVFLRQAQAGQGLAGVDDLGAGAGHGLHVGGGHGGGAGQQLHEVEAGALGGEQGAGRGVDFTEQLAGLDALAVAGVPDHRGVGLEGHEGGVEPGGAAQDRVLAGDHAAAGHAVGLHEAGGEVAGADVFGQEAATARWTSTRSCSVNSIGSHLRSTGPKFYHRGAAGCGPRGAGGGRDGVCRAISRRPLDEAPADR
jgi:hypothetical protein